MILIRNPFDALVAEWNRQQTSGNHTGVVESDSYFGNKFTCRPCPRCCTLTL